MKNRLLKAVIGALGLFSLAVQAQTPGVAGPATKREAASRERERRRPARKPVSKETRVNRWQTVIKCLEKSGVKDDQDLMRWARGNLKRAQHYRARGSRRGLGWFGGRSRERVHDRERKGERRDRTRRPKRERERKTTEQARKAKKAAARSR